MSEHVTIVCSAFGELGHHNKENWFQLNDGDDVTTNSTLQSLANKTDEELWDTMDGASFQILVTS